MLCVRQYYNTSAIGCGERSKLPNGVGSGAPVQVDFMQYLAWKSSLVAQLCATVLEKIQTALLKSSGNSHYHFQTWW